jgi:YfiH family protein
METESAISGNTLIRREVDGVVFYASPLLESHGIAHAFSTRVGGISQPPFDSMNLGNPNGCAVQDQTPNILENYRLLMNAMGCAGQPRYYLHQIHGDVVHVVDREDFNNSQKGDALVTTRSGAVLSVRVADCCPVLIASPDGKAVAAVHAGWRGAVGGVIAATIEKLQTIAGVNAADLLAAIGPCIGFDAFEVGPEVLAEFEKVFGSEAPIRHTPDGKGRVDLPRACLLQLRRAGITADHIDTTDRCTHRDADEFFSHRRDKGITGRMSALIAAK